MVNCCIPLTIDVLLYFTVHPCSLQKWEPNKAFTPPVYFVIYRNIIFSLTYLHIVFECENNQNVLSSSNVLRIMNIQLHHLAWQMKSECTHSVLWNILEDKREHGYPIRQDFLYFKKKILTSQNQQLIQKWSRQVYILSQSK